MPEDPILSPFKPRDRLVQILDPDPTVCESLSLLFRLEGYHTSFALETETFFPTFERRRPDVVIVNLELSNGSGIDVLRKVKAQRHATPVFLIANQPEVENTVLAMKAGATHVITKPIDGEYLLKIVREAVDVEMRYGALGGRMPIEVEGFDQLTARERQVLELISNGQSNKEAGRQLGISPRTIEVHRARVMEKLGARNTAELIRIVLSS
jgi:two-component system response regulator FixJ